MGIENIKNYLNSNLIKRAYIEMVKEFEKQDFDSEFALKIFIDQILNNYKNLKKLAIDYKDWYKAFPEEYFNLIDDKLIRQKISVAAIISEFFYKKSFEKSYFTEYIGISEYIKIKNIDIIFDKQDDIIKKYALYFYDYLGKDKRKNHILWLIRGNEARAFNLKVALHQNSSVEVITSNTSKENIRNFEESAKKALLSAKRIFNIDKKTGITIAVENLDENAIIAGNSATLSIFMEILKELFGEKTYLDTAYMSDIDFTNNSLVGIDPTGLRLKIQLAIAMDIKNVVIAKENYSAVHEFEDRINIIACEKLSEIIEFNKYLSKGFNFKKLKPFIFVFIILGLVLVLYNPVKNFLGSELLSTNSKESKEELMNQNDSNIKEIENKIEEIVESKDQKVPENKINNNTEIVITEKESENLENIEKNDEVTEKVEKEAIEKVKPVEEKEIENSAKEMQVEPEKVNEESLSEIVDLTNKNEEEIVESNTDQAIDKIVPVTEKKEELSTENKIEEPVKEEILSESAKEVKIIEALSDNSKESNFVESLKEESVQVNKEDIIDKVTEITEISNEKSNNKEEEKAIKDIIVEYYIYGIRETQEDWDLFEITDKTLLSTGDGIQVYLKTNQNAHLYVLNRDVKGKLNILFPWNNKEKNLVEADKEYVLPKDFEETSNSIDNYYYWVDDVYGKEHIYFIVSVENLELIDDAVSSYLKDGYIKKSTSTEILNWLDSNMNEEKVSGREQIFYSPTGKKYSRESKKIEGKNLIIQKKSYFHK